MTKKNSKNVAAEVVAEVVAVETVAPPALAPVELTPAEKAKQFTKEVCLAVARMLAALKIAGLDINYILCSRHDGSKTRVRDLCVALANPKQVDKDGASKPQSITEILTELGLSKGGTKPTPVQLLTAQIVATAQKCGLAVASKGRTAKNDPITNALAALNLSAEDWAAKRAVATQVETEVQVDFSFLD